VLLYVLGHLTWCKRGVCYVGSGTLQFVRCCLLLFPAVSCLKFYTQHYAGWYLSFRAFPEFRAESLKFSKHPHPRALKHIHISGPKEKVFKSPKVFPKTSCAPSHFTILGPKEGLRKPQGFS
jgi:hypothetical protein